MPTSSQNEPQVNEVEVACAALLSIPQLPAGRIVVEALRATRDSLEMVRRQKEHVESREINLLQQADKKIADLNRLAERRLELMEVQLADINNYKQGYGIPHEKFIERLNDANEGDYTGKLLQSSGVYSDEDLTNELRRRQHGKTKHPFPGKATALSDITLLIHYEQCPKCRGELDTGYECKVCGQQYANWIQYFGLLSLTAPSPDKPGMTLQQYQQNALITEAPVDEKRWESLSVPILANLERVQFLIYTTHLDNAKKFAAYGKLPKRGEFIHTENLSEFGFEYSYHDIPLDKPVYRALHAVVGIVTEVQELLEWLDTGVNGESGSYRRQTIQISAKTVKLENFDVTNLKEELGDFFWYFALLADVFGFTLQECLELNEKKLQQVRYKQGKFTPEEAAERDLEAERELLEGEGTNIYNGILHCGVDLATPGKGDWQWPTTESLKAARQEQEAKAMARAVANDQQITPRCADCSKPLVADGSILHCPSCNEEPALLEPTGEKPEAVRSEKNKNVWQQLVDYKDDNITLKPGEWYFANEIGIPYGPYAHEYIAIQKLEEYCVAVLGHPDTTPVDHSADVCGYCGKTGHSINECSERAGLAATPEKLQQERVPVVESVKKVLSAGDSVRSMRKSLAGYKFILNRYASEGETVHERVVYCSVDGLSPDNDAKLTLGEEIRLSPDELVKC